MGDEYAGIETLELERIIGFDGSVKCGLKVHPNRQHLIYPLGCNIIVEEIVKDGHGSQSVLSAHTDKVTCLAVSSSGCYMASGQSTHMGFKAPIIVWDFESRKPIKKLILHMVKVENLCFSADDNYLISLGGQDDGSVVVWSVATGTAICGSQAQVESAGNTFCVNASKRFENVFVTAGHDTLRVWTLDVENRKIRPQDVNLGSLKRVIKCIEMCDKECAPYFLCGTTTGDILAINMDSHRMAAFAPEKDSFSQGVTALAKVRGVMVECGEDYDGTRFSLPTWELLVGCGDGSLGQYTLKLTQVGKSNKIKTIFTRRPKTEMWRDNMAKNKCFALTSIALRGEGHQFFVGSANSQIYRFNYSEFACDLVKTCHSKAVNDIQFPFGTNELFVTCQDEEVRVWNANKGQEMKRYTINNMTCNAIAITRDGTTIYSAWADGKIRALGFAKEATKAMNKGDLYEKFAILDAHQKGVTALAITSDGRHIISGGGEGQVRLWSIEQGYDAKGKLVTRGVLLDTMKEHKGSVSAIKIRSNDKECVSASTDGTTIIWNLERRVRSQIMFANTLFRCVCYGSEDCHIITSGTDRKVVYWETLTGGQIRELEGSKTGGVNAMDISGDGMHFVTGGEEKLMKVWNYNEGEVTHVGIGHSASIKNVRICPNMMRIVSVGDDGAILLWKFPQSLRRT